MDVLAFKTALLSIGRDYSILASAAAPKSEHGSETHPLLRRCPC